MERALRWRIADVEIAFSEIRDGDVRSRISRDAFLTRVGCPRPCVVPNQVHGAWVVDAAANRADLAGADGLATSDAAVAVAVFGADCPGLVLVAKDALVVAHCGWRGTAAGIVGAAVAATASRTNARRAEWWAFIGPGICGDHYEIDAPVIDARPWPATALSQRTAERAHLDLATAMTHDLVGAGLAAARIRGSGVCTMEDDRLWSYRRRGQGLVQALVAWRAQSPR